MSDELHVDEDWKKRAQVEKEELARQFRGREKERKAGPAGKVMETASGASIPALVHTLATQAAMFLGLTPDPMSGTARADLAQARFIIDLLEVIAEKTKGNLAPEEERILGDALHDLRLAFVEVSKPRRPAAPKPKKEEL